MISWRSLFARGSEHRAPALIWSRSELHFKKKEKSKNLSAKLDYGILANEEEKSKNLSAKLDYGILADYAYENGFVGNFSRPTVELAIREFIDGPLQTAAPPQLTFAMECPGPEVLRGLYHLSLEAEEWAQRVMEGTGRTTYVEGGEVLSAEQRRDFDLHWNRTLEEGKLCSIDAAETMKNKKWKQFFWQN